jgi:hypothetical protein
MGEVLSQSFVATTFLQVLQSSLYIEPTFPFLSDLFYLLIPGVGCTWSHSVTQTTPLDEGSALRRDTYPTTHKIYFHAPVGIRTRTPSKQAAADPRLRPLGHRIGIKLTKKRK